MQYILNVIPKISLGCQATLSHTERECRYLGGWPSSYYDIGPNVVARRVFANDSPCSTQVSFPNTLLLTGLPAPHPVENKLPQGGGVEVSVGGWHKNSSSASCDISILSPPSPCPPVVGVCVVKRLCNMHVSTAPDPLSSAFLPPSVCPDNELALGVL